MAQRLYDITALEPLIQQGFTLLTPNQRLARRIKSLWDERRAEAGERSWQALPVYTLESWLLGRWELAVSLGLLAPAAPLGTAQALELWRQVIGAQQRQAAHLQLLLPSAAAQIAHQARESLLRWQVDTGAYSVRQLFALDRDCATFWQWLHAFEARLEESGLCMPEDCMAQLLCVAARMPRHRVVLLEFDEIPPLLRATVEAMSEPLRHIAPIAASPHRLLHPFSDKRTELQAVATWARAAHRTHPQTTIGIVIADVNRDRVALEHLLRQEFDCLGENYNSLPVNFSTGIPLSQAPLVRDALEVLALGLSHTTVAAVVRLMHSRFLSPHGPSASRQRLVTALQAMARETVSVEDLQTSAERCADESDPTFAQCLKALSARRELRRSATPSLWTVHFSHLLADWGWPGRQPLDSVEHQQWEQWYRALDEFRAFDAVCGKLRYDEALGLFGDCCARQVSHPQTADTPIHVLGPLEAAGLTFDHLWMCAMQASSWPAPARPNPLIPLSLQSRLGMPHATPEREQAFSAALLQRYSNSSRVLHASYARQVDGVPDGPSPMLQDFNFQPVPEPPPFPAAWTLAAETVGMERVPDHFAPPLDPAAQTILAGGSAVLEDQSHCAFRAFARHRLRIAAPEAPGAGVSAGERGSLLHAALYVLWGSLGDSATLQATDAAAQERVVENAIDIALRTLPAASRRNISSGYWRLERQRLAALLREWLAVERQRSDFRVVAREQSFAIKLAGLQLQLRVDRIDQLHDGSQMIIDYKSGLSSVRDWLGERPAKPQLLLYAVAQPGAAAALAFAHVRARHCGFTGLGRIAAAQGIRTDIAGAVENDMAAGDWQSLNERWRAQLQQLAEAFVSGEAQVDPRSAASCDRCGLQPLCRIGGPAASAEEAAP